jgi:putative ABC transport system permease protein
LFGLASFVTEQRKKEIGIRKILGASVFELIIMLSKEFTIWVLIANLIAWPAAYLIMNNWLANFAYRTNIGFGIFLLSGVAALIIALFTVSIHTIKASTANPIDSLHYE